MKIETLTYSAGDTTFHGCFVPTSWRALERTARGRADAKAQGLKLVKRSTC